MPRGFFFESDYRQGEKIQSRVPKCGACGLYKVCKSPKMPTSGKGERKILVIAEAPGEQEDAEGIQLIGNSGRMVEEAFRRVGVNMRRDCWLTNALICRPPNNETPHPKQIDHCRPNLFNTIDELQPEVIVTLGGSAVQSLLGQVYKESVGKVSRWVGWKIPCMKPNAWICPTWHPAYLLRAKNPVLDRLFQRHLEVAADIESRPWETPPDYRKEITIIIDPDEAAAIVRKWSRRGGTFAFDYETNMLKPDSDERRIVSCSICRNGEQTIAYPWHGDAITATREFLDTPYPKIASNLKFEERWTLAEFGRGVNGWQWCTMNNAHLIDNRSGITSIKFQAFIHLGAEVYDHHIAPLLKAKGKGTINQILKEIKLEDLLLYNGLDSLLEYKVAMLQMKALQFDREEYE